MLKNAALDAKIGVDTAENEPQKGSEKMGSLKDPVGYPQLCSQAGAF